jgi:ferredoxin
MNAPTFFKLIAGGSLTDVDTVAFLAQVYTTADCIDVAPEPAVVEAVSAVLPETGGPTLMVSVPLDPDPHFRKIEVKDPDCILCGACVPVCPADALTLAPDQLAIEQPLCYGCGRCLPVCPTDALVLHPFRVEENVQAVLSHWRVGAVELHTRYADPAMLNDFMLQYAPLLRDKWVSVCFSPNHTDQWPALLHALTAWEEQVAGILLQVDGQPMSGTEHPNASLPALTGALAVLAKLPRPWPVTISGGINAHTAELLHQSAYAGIAGVGMGTMARKAVLPYRQNPNQAREVAHALVATFHARPVSSIIRMSNPRLILSFQEGPRVR